MSLYQFETSTGHSDPLFMLRGANASSFDNSAFSVRAPYADGSNSLLMGGATKRSPEEISKHQTEVSASYNDEAGEFLARIELEEPVSSVVVTMPTQEHGLEFEDKVVAIDLGVYATEDMVGISFIGESGDHLEIEGLDEAVLQQAANALNLVLCKQAARMHGELDW